MPTLDKTRLRNLIVTAGDVVHGEDGSVSPPVTPAPLTARGGEDSATPVDGAPGEFRGGDGLVGTANGGGGTFRAGDGDNGAPGEFRGGDGSGAAGGPGDFRAGDGVTSGGPGEFRAGNATAGPGGSARFAAGNGTIGGPLTLEAGIGTSGLGGALSVIAGDGVSGGGPLSLAAGDGSGGGALTIAAGTGVSLGGPLSISAGDDTGTSGDGGDCTIAAGSVTNLLGLGDGGDLVLLKGTAAGSGSDGFLIFDYAKWPQTDGLAGQQLQTDGLGNLSWASGGGGESLAATMLIGNTTASSELIVSGGAGTGVTFATTSTFINDALSAFTISTADAGGITVDTTPGTGPINLTPGGALTLDFAAWPGTDGAPGNVLVTDGAGTLSFAGSITAADGSGAAGSDASVTGGNGDTGFAGGNVVLAAGIGSSAPDGEVQITRGDIVHSSPTFTDTTLEMGATALEYALLVASVGTGTGKDLHLTAGDTTATLGDGGKLILEVGTEGPGGTRGVMELRADTVEPQPVTTVEFAIALPTPASGDGNDFRIKAADGFGSGDDGGDTFVVAGATGGGAGVAGNVNLLAESVVLNTQTGTEAGRITPTSFDVKIEGKDAAVASGLAGNTVTVEGGTGDGVGNGGTVFLQGGGTTTGTNGAITMTTDGTDAPVGIRTTSGFTSTNCEQLTYAIQATLPVGTQTTIVTLGTISTVDRNMKFNVQATATDSTSATDFVSYHDVTAAVRGTGAPTLLGISHVPAASQNQTSGSGMAADVTFNLTVSGNDINLRAFNISSTTTYTANIAVCWTRQLGGAPS